MEISDIKIRKTMHEGRLRALVSITIDNAIAVHEIKIVQGDERLFVDRKSTRLNSSHANESRMPSSA